MNKRPKKSEGPYHLAELDKKEDLVNRVLAKAKFTGWTAKRTWTLDMPEFGSVGCEYVDVGPIEKYECVSGETMEAKVKRGRIVDEIQAKQASGVRAALRAAGIETKLKYGEIVAFYRFLGASRSGVRKGSAVGTRASRRLRPTKTGVRRRSH